MKQQEVFKRIGIIIKELNQQYDYLSATPDQLNDLELELFVANAHFLADHSEVLSKLNLQNTPPPPAEKPKTSYEEKHFEPLVQQVKPAATENISTEPLKPVEVEITHAATDDRTRQGIDLQGDSSDEGEESFSFIRQEPEIIKHELILDESEDWDEDDDGFISDDLAEEPEGEMAPEETPVIETVAEEPAAVNEPGPVEPTIVPAQEDFTKIQNDPAPIESRHKPQTTITPETGEPLTINQRLSAQLNPAPRVTEHLNTQVVTDLKQAINLNDKLLYVRDLFNGYSLAYSEVMDILNRFSSFEEADKFLKANYATKNNWESKQATVDKFYVLLRRRYL